MNIRLVDMHMANITFERRRAIWWRLLGICGAGAALWLILIGVFYYLFKMI